MNSSQQQRLLSYVKKIIGVQTEAEVFEWINAHAPLKAQFDRLVEEEAEKAKSASSQARGLENLEAPGGIPSHVGRALEAIVNLTMRPVINVNHDDFTEPDVPFGYLHNDATLHERIRKAIPSVGRIGVPNLSQLPYGGTGFVVGDDLLMTNRHVAELVCSGLGQKALSFRTGQTANIDFKKEARPNDASNTFLFDIEDIVLIHPYWDMALFRTKGLSEKGVPALVLSTEPVKDLQGTVVVAIGYPAMDWRNDFQEQMRIFNGVFNVKRLQPGMITGTVQVDSFDKKVDALGHDASTLGGASGSALVDPKTGLAVGLHFGGVYLVGNYAVPLSVLAEDKRLSGLGIKFEGTRKTSVGPWDAYWANTDLGQEAVPTGAPASFGSTPAQSPPVMQSPPPAQSNEWRMTVPLEIIVRLGTSQGPAAPAVAPIRPGPGGETNLPGVIAPAATSAVLPPMPVEIPAGKVGDPSLLSRRGFDLELALFLAQASAAAYGNAIEMNAWALAQGFAVCQPIDRGNIQGFWCTKDESALLVFRGTSNPDQWFRDAQFLYVPHRWGSVHMGFRNGILNVEPDLEQFDRAATKARNLWICGHSLGGALAVLAGARMKINNFNPSIYTFGQPLVGLNDFATKFDQELPRQLYRVVNQDDAIARVPPMPYRHCLTPKWIVRPGTLESISAPIIESELSPCRPEEYEELKRRLEKASDASSASSLEGTDIGGYISFIRNHYINEYIQQLTRLKSA